MVNWKEKMIDNKTCIRIIGFIGQEDRAMLRSNLSACTDAEVCKRGASIIWMLLRNNIYFGFKAINLNGDISSPLPTGRTYVQYIRWDSSGRVISRKCLIYSFY